MMTIGEIDRRMKSLNNWALDGSFISKEFSFPSFKESIVFVNKVAELAEKHSHHPDILINYRTVRLMLTTHEERGLSIKDFNLAEEIDKIIL